MKLVKNFLFAALLVSTIAFNTPAGEMDLPGYVPPPPPRAASTCDDITEITDPNIEQCGVVITVETSDYFLYEALAAFLSVY
jgi:hypothetical protein